jgi:TatD DNase family protein
MIFTDSHAHLASVAEELGADALALLLASYSEAAAAASREGRARPLLVDIGTEPGDLAARISLLGPGAEDRATFLRLSAGIWPSAENLASPKASIAGLEAAIEEASRLGVRVAAIGEGGLDYHYMDGDKKAQAELFEGQLALASRLSLPMIVHSRDAAADTLALIGSALAQASAPVIIHCFGYGPDEARAFLDLGCYVSFAGNLTYKGSDGLREACSLIPGDRLLLETDSPYMNPVPRRGKPSSPRDVERSYALAATIRGEPVDALAETVSRNARTLFG